MSHLIADDDKVKNVKDLINELEAFSKRLTQRNSLVVHRQIDQFFYMQKTAELKILLNEYQLASDRLLEITNWLDEKYCLGVNRLSEDIACLNEIEANGV